MIWINEVATVKTVFVTECNLSSNWGPTQPAIVRGKGSEQGRIQKGMMAV